MSRREIKKRLKADRKERERALKDRNMCEYISLGNVIDALEFMLIK